MYRSFLVHNDSTYITIYIEQQNNIDITHSNKLYIK